MERYVLIALDRDLHNFNLEKDISSIFAIEVIKCYLLLFHVFLNPVCYCMFHHEDWISSDISMVIKPNSIKINQLCYS